eukprot:scaffold6638_cov76-Phaeocystis_antarctica.AAC.4
MEKESMPDTAHEATTASSTGMSSCCWRVNSRQMSAVLSVCVVPAASAAAPTTEMTAGGSMSPSIPKTSCAISA